MLTLNWVPTRKWRKELLNENSLYVEERVNYETILTCTTDAVVIHLG
jgi:hypothetical protein